MSAKVKICGITNKEDAVWAVNYGADYIGLNFYKESPRHVSVATAVKWLPEVPSFIPKVGVFVDASNEEILKTVDKLNLKGVQLHGQETPDFVRQLKIEFAGQGRPVFIIKAFHIKDESSLADIGAYLESVDFLLLDSMVEGQMGGTGERFNWEIALKAKELGKPIFLAGGLNPDNVKEAIKKVGPFAVDVASGVEKSPKRKDVEKLKNFVQAAKK